MTGRPASPTDRKRRLPDAAAAAGAAATAGPSELAWLAAELAAARTCQGASCP